MKPVGFALPADPLRIAGRLPLSRHLSVLGLRVHFASNSADVVAAVDRSFGAVADLLPPLSAEAPVAAHVRLWVQEDVKVESSPLQVEYCWPSRRRFALRAEGGYGIADIDGHEAAAVVTPALVEKELLFQSAVLEALTLMLVTHQDRYPVHAATLVRNQSAVFLVGPSGSGKSTVAFAALRRGWRLLGEEAAYVQLRPVPRIWGLPRSIGLPPASIDFFPDLQDRAVRRLPSGKEKVVIPLGPSGREVVGTVRSGVICLLERGAAPATLSRVPPDEMLEALMAGLEPGFDTDPDAARAVATHLAQPGGWRLCHRDDPYESVRLLGRLGEAGGREMEVEALF